MDVCSSTSDNCGDSTVDTTTVDTSPKPFDKLTFITEQLQSMVETLSPKQRQNFPKELISSLAESLMDNTVFGIINHLVEIQNHTEIQLFNQKLAIKNRQFVDVYKCNHSELKDNEKEAVLTILRERHKQEMTDFDKFIVMQLEETRRDQQGVLAMAEVPGFEKTENPMKLKVQVRLLSFILQLKHILPMIED